MSPLSSFAQHAVDLLAGVGPVKARAMFGGYGLSLNGVSIGLIADDRLYLRTDDTTRSRFESAGSAPFIYQSKNGPMTMKSYWAMPEDSVDDPELAAQWGRLAAEAARRAAATKASGSPRKTSKTSRPGKGSRASAKKPAPARNAKSAPARRRARR